MKTEIVVVFNAATQKDEDYSAYVDDNSELVLTPLNGGNALKVPATVDSKTKLKDWLAAHKKNNILDTSKIVDEAARESKFKKIFG